MKGQDFITANTVARGKKGVRGLANNAVSISFEGLDETIKAFNEIATDERINELGPATIEAAEIIAKKARENVNPINNPGLREAIVVHKPGRKRGKAYQIFARVGFSTKTMKGSSGGGEYGAAVELGHRLVVHNREAGVVSEHPFLRPAADESRQEVEDILIDALNRIISDAWSK